MNQDKVASGSARRLPLNFDVKRHANPVLRCDNSCDNPCLVDRLHLYGNAVDRPRARDSRISCHRASQRTRGASLLVR